MKIFNPNLSADIEPPFRTLLLMALSGLISQGAWAGAYYNLTQYEALSSTRVSLPAVWQPTPVEVTYTGSLDVHWLARLQSDQETLEISGANARSHGLPDSYRLLTTPPNCWGMDMGFGLVTLEQPAHLNVTVAADDSGLVPAFALYRGWDQGQSSYRHTTIYFGSNDPLGSQGLSFLGDALGEQGGGSISRTFTELPAGNYEIFVTVGTNDSPGGDYRVSLTTTPLDHPPAPVIDGRCGEAADQLSPTEPPLASLCAAGSSSQLKRLAKSRYEWLCDGEGAGAWGSRCYTLAEDGRQNQAPLNLEPGSVTLRSGESVTQMALGGSGSGRITFARKSATPGTRCRLKKSGNQVTLRARGTPGSCVMTAKKQKSKGFNKGESYPVTITVE